MSTCNFVQTLYPTPVGVFTIIADSTGLARILGPMETANRRKNKTEILACTGQNIHLSQTTKALENYFSKKSFELPRLSKEGTDFQKSVWEALIHIPHGTTQTYAQIATSIGRPRAIRAVATAIGKNPFYILVPCHRVIGTDGSLRGFAEGLVAKKWLLDFESTP